MKNWNWTWNLYIFWDKIFFPDKMLHFEKLIIVMVKSYEFFGKMLRKYLLLSLIPLLLIVPSIAFGEEIPNWIRNNAGWWADGQIDDNTFVQGIEYLIQNKVIVTDNEISQNAKGDSSEKNIPGWIKNNAGWWAEGSINTESFMEGIEFLVRDGLVGFSDNQSTPITNYIKIQKESTIQGLKITLTNNDNKIHAVTSGSIQNGPDGKFDTGILNPSMSYSMVAIDSGTMDYFCMIHPWMQGTVSVSEEDVFLFNQELERKELEKEKEEERQEIIQQKVSEISRDFYVSMDVQWLEPKSQLELPYVEEIKKSMSQDELQRLERLQKLLLSTYPENPYSLQTIANNLSHDDRIFVSELMLKSLKFAAQKLNQQNIQVDLTYEQAVKEINELEISDEDKSKHIETLTYEKSKFKTVLYPVLSSGIGKMITDGESQLNVMKIGTLEETTSLRCGEGTIEKNGQCVVDPNLTMEPEPISSKGGGCLIATATFDSELSPQVQKLREIRDSKLLSTESGSQFLESFNQFYYSFSPIIADYERENPVFKELVTLGITPMLSTLSLMDYADTESEVLGIGISLIILNGIMYVGLPVFGIMRIRKCGQ